MSKVIVVIVNWNTGDCLARCLKSLQALPERDQAIDEAVVVDNASTDRSLVKAQVAVGESINKPRVRFIKQSKNAGFARANNAAIMSALNCGGEKRHVLLLNPDTEVKPGALATMVQVLEEDSRIGVVGPRLLNSDGSGQPSVRSFPTFGVFMFLLLKLNHLVPRAKLWLQYMQNNFDYSRQSEVDQVMGAAFLIRGELLESVGLLEEKFWVWFEEVDYCQRVKAAGYKIVYTPRAEIVHHGAVSFNQLVGFRRSLPWLKSSLNYAEKYLAWYEVVLLWLLAPISILLMVPATFLHMKKKTNENV